MKTCKTTVRHDGIKPFWSHKERLAIHYKHNFGCTITNPLANHIKEKIRLLKPFCLEIA